MASPKKPREMLKLVITAFGGGLVGAFVGMFFMRVSIPSSLSCHSTCRCTLLFVCMALHA